jgi:uncharacterized membrane protein (DUF373 family)
LKFDLGRVYEWVIWIAVDALIVLLLVELVWGVVSVAFLLFNAFTNGLTDAFKDITVQALNVFIFIEILQSLIDYTHQHRINIVYLADASLAFILRETWVGLFGGHLQWQTLLALAAFVLALAAMRTVTLVYAPRMVEAVKVAEELGAEGKP